MDTLHIISIISLIAGGVCSLIILIDSLSGSRQKMMIMNFVYPITGLYGSVFALIFYFTIGRKSVCGKIDGSKRFHTSSKKLFLAKYGYFPTNWWLIKRN
ncbi:MAG: hypothetical protein ABI261_08690 [Ginsengibacter sp.]